MIPATDSTRGRADSVACGAFSLKATPSPSPFLDAVRRISTSLERADLRISRFSSATCCNTLGSTRRIFASRYFEKST